MKARIVSMTIVVLASMGVMEASTAGSLGSSRHHPGGASISVVGTWQLVWPEKEAREREIKLITPTHFTWTTWNTETHHVLASGGGPYTLVGRNYCEQLSFAQGEVEAVAGAVLCFDVHVKGDTLLQLGPLSADGSRSREVWKRLK